MYLHCIYASQFRPVNRFSSKKTGELYPAPKIVESTKIQQSKAAKKPNSQTAVNWVNWLNRLIKGMGQRGLTVPFDPADGTGNPN